MTQTNYTNLLLVEDDHDDQEIFTHVLGDVAPSVACKTANNGLEALEVLESRPLPTPDLIFLDLNMPKMNGVEFLERLRADARYEWVKSIPIVVLSTSCDEQEQCINLGACLCLVKPNSIVRLRKMLTAVLESDVLRQREELVKQFSQN